MCRYATPVTETTTCHLCGATASETLFAARDRLNLADREFEVHRCAACGLAWTWPPASEADLARYYPDEYWGESSEPSHEKIVRSQREKTAVVEAHRPQGGKVLDVGCGAGFFLRALPAPRWERWGVEISPRSAHAAERHIGAGRVFAGRLVDAAFERGSFDVVSFWSALEHVSNPRADLLIAHRVLADDGALVVQVPNFGSSQARRFGPDWFALDLPRHRFHFTPETLGRLLHEAGFDVIKTIYYSQTHDPHGLKQSLKSRWIARRAPLGALRYYTAAPFLKLVSRATGGATLTVVARRRSTPQSIS